MNFRTFKQNKLVRDKILEIMTNHGSKLYSYALNDVDFEKQLKIKLIEEAHEVQQSNNSQELLEELADVMEIVHQLLSLHNFTITELNKAQKAKRDTKGGYNNRCFVTFAEHPKDSPQERYCLADPKKYPEVKN